MDTYQLIWLIILTPIFFFYGAKELDRGWKILKHGEFSLDLAIQIRIWLVWLVSGADAAKQYEINFKRDLETMRMMGIYSIMGGIASWVVSIMWIWVLSRAF